MHGKTTHNLNSQILVFDSFLPVGNFRAYDDKHNKSILTV